MVSVRGRPRWSARPGTDWRLIAPRRMRSNIVAVNSLSVTLPCEISAPTSAGVRSDRRLLLVLAVVVDRGSLP